MTIREAVLLSAGFGTRMRPMTLGIPKPALPFLNRPVMHWALDGLVETGIERVLVNLHHLPDKVREPPQPILHPWTSSFPTSQSYWGRRVFWGL